MVRRYGVAVLSTGLALLLTLLLAPWLDLPVSPLFFAAVAVSAWYGGFGPGLCAALLSTLAINYLFISPPVAPVPIGPGTLVRLLSFLIVALLISSLQAERGRAVQRLGFERQLLETVLQQMPAGVVMAEAPAGRIVMGNEAAERILGHPVILARTVDEYAAYRLVHLDGRPYQSHEYPLVRALRHGEVVRSEEAMYLRPDGERRYLLLHAAPVRDENGRIIAGVVIFDDVTPQVEARTERERLLQQTSAERAWLRAVIEQSPVGILLIEDAGRERITPNRRAEAIFGRPLPPEGGIDQYIGLAFYPDGTPIPRDELASVRALKGEVVTGVEETVRRPDGRELSVRVSARPIRDATGRVAGAVVIFEDITPFKELERLREEWASVIAHDLRQPLTVIRGYLGVLQRALQQPLTPTTARALEHIGSAVSSLEKMVNDLLDISRIEARRLTIQRRPVDMASLLQAAVERAGGVTRGHAVRVDVKGPLPTVSVDPGRIEQVLVNLLSNAAKYGDPGTPILVEAQRTDGEVLVAVTNWGRGIKAEDLPRLFTRFHRTREAREEQVPGLGLGLYISRGLVEAHGGRIWAKSTPGKTTTFFFTVPIATEER